MGAQSAGDEPAEVCAIAVFRSRAALAGALVAAVLAGGPRGIPVFGAGAAGASPDEPVGEVDGYTETRSTEASWAWQLADRTLMHPGG